MDPDRPARPLLVTADVDLLDELLRLVATAGVEADVAVDAAAARDRWGRAGCVVVGADAAAACLRSRLPRRPGVVLLAHGDDPEVWQRAVGLGAEQVLLLPADELALTARLADAAENGLADAPLLAVVGGCGGAGATTFACALAVTAARSGQRALLLDGDPLGGGIDLALGGEGEPGPRWPALGGTSGRLPAAALADALPRMAGAAVLSWDRGPAASVTAEAVEAVVAAGRRGHDLVVADLPRSTDAPTRALLQAAAVVLVVVPAGVRAAAAAGRIAEAALTCARDVRLVVRGPGQPVWTPRQWPGCWACRWPAGCRPSPGWRLPSSAASPPPAPGGGRWPSCPGACSRSSSPVHGGRREHARPGPARAGAPPGDRRGRPAQPRPGGRGAAGRGRRAARRHRAAHRPGGTAGRDRRRRPARGAAA